MASSGVTSTSINNTDSSAGDASCESDPNFAVICGFLERFGVHCGLGEMDFLDLQEMIENTQEIAPELIDLHIKLLRKIRKSASTERWERAVIKVCHSYNSQDAWEFERFGYKKAKLSSKLRLLKQLLEMQFDLNVKFKNEINKMSASDLRAQPLGRDKMGNAYWFQTDDSCQVRVYKEDPDEETWQLVVKDREGLVSLITELGSGEPLPTTLTSATDSATNEDSNSLEVIDKPIILDTGQTCDSKRTSEDGSELEEEEDIENGKSGRVPKDSKSKETKDIETKEPANTGIVEEPTKIKTQLIKNEDENKQKLIDETKEQAKDELNKPKLIIKNQKDEIKPVIDELKKKKSLVKDQNDDTVDMLKKKEEIVKDDVNAKSDELKKKNDEDQKDDANVDEIIKQKTLVKVQHETTKSEGKVVFKNPDELLKNNDKDSKEKKTPVKQVDAGIDLSKSQTMKLMPEEKMDPEETKVPKDTMVEIKIKKHSAQPTDLTKGENKNTSDSNIPSQSRIEIKPQIISESNILSGHSISEIKTATGYSMTIKGHTKIPIPPAQMKLPPGNSITEIKNQPKKTSGYHTSHLITEMKAEMGHTYDHTKAKSIIIGDPKTFLSTNSQISISPIKPAINVLNKSEIKVNPSVTMLKVPTSEGHVPIPHVKGLSITKTKGQYFVPKMKERGDPKGHYMTDMKWGEGSSHWSPPETRGHPMEELMKMGLVKESQSQAEEKPKGLRLKPLTELLSSQVMHGVKEKYIRSDPFAGQMSNRKAVESYRALYPDLKRSHSFEMEQPPNILKMPRLDRPTLLGGGKNLQKPYGGEEEDEDDPDSEVGDEIEEPLMLVTGRGSGEDNKCGNLKRTEQKPESDQLCRLLNNFEIARNRELLDLDMVLLERQLATPNLDFLKRLCLPREYRDDYNNLSIFNSKNVLKSFNKQNSQVVTNMTCAKSLLLQNIEDNTTNYLNDLEKTNVNNLESQTIITGQFFSQVKNKQYCTNISRGFIHSTYKSCGLKILEQISQNNLNDSLKYNNSNDLNPIRRSQGEQEKPISRLTTNADQNYDLENHTKLMTVCADNQNSQISSWINEASMSISKAQPSTQNHKIFNSTNLVTSAAREIDEISGLTDKYLVSSNEKANSEYNTSILIAKNVLSSNNSDKSETSKDGGLLPNDDDFLCSLNKNPHFEPSKDNLLKDVDERFNLNSSNVNPDQNLHFDTSHSSELDISPIIGETIEEEVMYITGFGQGHSCQTGNERTDGGEAKEETTPTKKSATDEKGGSFFFGSGSMFGSLGNSTAVAKTSLTFGSPVKNKSDQPQDGDSRDSDMEMQLESTVNNSENLTGNNSNTNLLNFVPDEGSSNVSEDSGSTKKLAILNEAPIESLEDAVSNNTLPKCKLPASNNKLLEVMDLKKPDVTDVSKTKNFLKLEKDDEVIPKAKPETVKKETTEVLKTTDLRQTEKVYAKELKEDKIILENTNRSLDIATKDKKLQKENSNVAKVSKLAKVIDTVNLEINKESNKDSECSNKTQKDNKKPVDINETSEKVSKISNEKIKETTTQVSKEKVEKQVSMGCKVSNEEKAEAQAKMVSNLPNEGIIKAEVSNEKKVEEKSAQAATVSKVFNENSMTIVESNDRKNLGENLKRNKVMFKGNKTFVGLTKIVNDLKSNKSASKALKLEKDEHKNVADSAIKIDSKEIKFSETRDEANISKSTIKISDTETNALQDVIYTKKVSENMNSEKNKMITPKIEDVNKMQSTNAVSETLKLVSAETKMRTEELKITPKNVVSNKIQDSKVDIDSIVSNTGLEDNLKSSKDKLMTPAVSRSSNVSAGKESFVENDKNSNQDINRLLQVTPEKAITGKMIRSGDKKDMGDQGKAGVRRIKVTPTRAELKMKDKSPQAPKFVDKSPHSKTAVNKSPHSETTVKIVKLEESISNDSTKLGNNPKSSDEISKLEEVSRLQDKETKFEVKLDVLKESSGIGDENEDNDGAKNKKVRKGRKVGGPNEKEEKSGKNEGKQENVQGNKNVRKKVESDEEDETEDEQSSSGVEEGVNKVNNALREGNMRKEVVKENKSKDLISEDNPSGAKKKDSTSGKDDIPDDKNNPEDQDGKTIGRKSARSSPEHVLMQPVEENEEKESKKEDALKKPTRRSLRGRIEDKEEENKVQPTLGKKKVLKITEGAEELMEEKRGKGKKIAAKKVNEEKNIIEDETGAKTKKITARKINEDIEKKDQEDGAGKRKKSAMKIVNEEVNDQEEVITKGKKAIGKTINDDMEKNAEKEEAVGIGKNAAVKRISDDIDEEVVGKTKKAVGKKTNEDINQEEVKKNALRKDEVESEEDKDTKSKGEKDGTEEEEDEPVKKMTPVGEGGRSTRRSKIAKCEEQDVVENKKKMDEAKKSMKNDEDEENLKGKPKRNTRGNAKPITSKIAKGKKDAKSKEDIDDDEDEKKKATPPKKGRWGRGKESVAAKKSKVNDDADDEEEENEEDESVPKKNVRMRKKGKQKVAKVKEVRKGKKGGGKKAAIETEESDDDDNNDVVNSVPGSDDDDDVSMTKDSDAIYNKDDSSSLSKDIKSETEDDKTPKKSITLATLSLDYDEDATNTVGDIQKVIKQMSRSADKKRKQEEEEEEDSEKKQVEPKPKKKKKRKTLLGLDIAEQQQNSLEEGRGVRQSRRIAQIKIKEEAERRKVEDEITSPKEKIKEGKGKKRKIVVISEDEKSPPPSKKDKDEDCVPVKLHKKKRRKSNPKFDETRPWKSSSDDTSSGEEEEEHEEELEYEEDPGSPLFKSDHEFSPESDLEEGESGLPLKRARTVKKEDAIEDEDLEDDTDCQKCGKSDHPEWILLCDGCDAGWHCSCLRPALLVIPEGDWYCPPCQHAALLKNLQEKLIEYDRRISKREIEVRRKERLAYVGISLDNVLPSKTKDDSKETKEGSSSSDSESSDSNSDRSSDSDSDEPIYQLRQRRKAHSYRFNDYDELINSAIQEEIKEEQPEPERHHGKDIANIINANEKSKNEEADESQELKPPVKTDPKEEDDEDEDIIVKKPKLIGRKKQRKLNSLDVSSEGEDSDEDFKGSTSDEDEDDFEDSDGSSDSYIKKRPTRRSTRARTSRYDKDFINDDSSYTSSDNGYKKKKKNKKKKRKTRWDSDESESISDSELSDIRSKKSKKRKQKRWVDSDSELSDLPRKSKKKSRKKDKQRKVKEAKPMRRRIKYGGLSSDEGVEEDDGLDDGKRRTRGKKINYVDVLGTDSDDSVRRKKAQVEEESEDEFVLNEEDNPDEEYVANSDDSDENPRLVEGVIRAGTKKGVGKGGIKRIKRAQAEEEDLFPPLESGAEPNTIEQINKNIESVDEVMMEEEEYANRQLQMVAQELEKEKRRKELEAARKQLLQETEPATTVAMTTKAPTVDTSPEVQVAKTPSDTTISTPSGVTMAMAPMPQAPVAVPIVSSLAMTPPLPQGPSAVPVAMSMPRAPAAIPVAMRPTSPIQHNIPPASVALAMTMSSMPQAPGAIPVTLPPQGPVAIPVTLPPQGPAAIPVSAPTQKPVPMPRNIQPSMKMPQAPVLAGMPHPPPTAVSVAMTTILPPQGPTAVPVVMNKSPLPIVQTQTPPIPVAMATPPPSMPISSTPPSIPISSTPPPVTVEMVQNESKISEVLSESPKKRGRKPKSAATEDGPSPGSTGSDFSDASLPMMLNPDGTPKKRRGRGKGKKTLEKEAAAAAAAAALLTANSASVPPPDEDDSNIPLTIESPTGSGGKLGVASAPQPFSQSQPKPSVITRMLQAQPPPNSAAPPGYPPPPTQAPQQPPHKFLNEGPPTPGGGRPSPPVQQQQPPPPPGYMPSPRGILPPSSQPPGQFRPSLNHYPPQRPPPPQGVRPNHPHPFHTHPTHHPLDPSPSGGGQISPPTSTPSGPDHPPPPLRHLPPPRQQYHPSYYSYPPPDEEHPDEMEMYPHQERNYEEEPPVGGGEEENGEFGGLVSYFSSQREDDLDT